MSSPINYSENRRYVNTNLLGIPHPWKSTAPNTLDGVGTGPGTPYIEHPSLRQSFKTIDRFRGAMGLYYTAATSSIDGRGRPNIRIFARNNSNWIPNYMPLNYDFQNIDLEDRMIITYSNPRWNSLNELGNNQNPGMGGHMSQGPGNIVDGRISRGTWNLLDHVDQDDIEGDPYFNFFLVDGFPSSAYRIGNSETIPAIFNRTNNNQWFYDLSFEYSKPSDSEVILEESQYDISVRAVYQHYLPTSPPYESIIENVPECMLPNYYVFESELLNETTTPNCSKYRQMLELASATNGTNPGATFGEGFAGGWFVDHPTAGVTETTMGEYFQLLAQGYREILNRPNLEVQDYYEKNYRDFAVVYKDINVLTNVDVRDDRGTSDTGDDIMAIDQYPFYNKITIGPDPEDIPAQRETDFEAVSVDTMPWGNRARSFFSNILTLDGGLDYITILQNRVISQINSPTSKNAVWNNWGTHPTQPFYVEKERYRANLAEDESFNVVKENTSRVLSLNNFTSRVQHNNWYGTSTKNTYQNKQFSSSWLTNVYGRITYLRDYSAGPTSDTVYAGSGDLSDENPNTPGPGRYRYWKAKAVATGADLWQWINDRTRDMQQVHDGVSSWSETLMYVVEKYAIPSVMLGVGTDQNAPTGGHASFAQLHGGQLVQKFYITKNFENPEANLTYYDTQVKYGVTYWYDIKQVRVVFGTKYGYRDPQLWYGPRGGYGRAIGNALGRYQEEYDSNNTTINNPEYSPWYDQFFAEQGVNMLLGSSQPYSPENSDSFPVPGAQVGYYIYYPQNMNQDINPGQGDGVAPRDMINETGTTYDGDMTDVSMVLMQYWQDIYNLSYRPSDSQVPGLGSTSDSQFARQHADYPASGYNNSTFQDSTLWQKFTLVMKTGFGLDGNDSGGAIPGTYWDTNAAAGSQCEDDEIWNPWLQICMPATDPIDGGGLDLIDPGDIDLIDAVEDQETWQEFLAEQIDIVLEGALLAGVLDELEQSAASGQPPGMSGAMWDVIQDLMNGTGPFDGGLGDELSQRFDDYFGGYGDSLDPSNMPTEPGNFLAWLQGFAAGSENFGDMPQNFQNLTGHNFGSNEISTFNLNFTEPQLASMFDYSTSTGGGTDKTTSFSIAVDVGDDIQNSVPHGWGNTQLMPMTFLFGLWSDLVGDAAGFGFNTGQLGDLIVDAANGDAISEETLGEIITSMQASGHTVGDIRDTLMEQGFSGNTLTAAGISGFAATGLSMGFF